MRLYFLLPALNEEASIAAQIKKLCELADGLGIDRTVVVINDGSTDSTRSIVEALTKADDTVVLINHPENAGPGRAFLTGFEAIIERADDDDLVISMDADNTQNENTVKMMIARANEGYEMVIASVYAPGGMFIGLPLMRYVLTMACNLLYRVLFPVAGIKEYTGFYRCYRVSALRRAFAYYEARGSKFLTVDGFGTAAEQLIRMRRIPVFMTEVPMLNRYDQKEGKSKLRIVPTIAEHLRLISKNVFDRSVL